MINIGKYSPHDITTIDILSAIAIAGLIGFGTPQLVEILRSREQITAVEEFGNMISYAQQQALLHKTSISLCIANTNQTDCSETDKNWSNGYLVKINDSGTILKNREKLSSDVNILSRGENRIVFTGNGMLSEARIFKFCNNSNTGTTHTMIINLGSQIRTTSFPQSGRCDS